MSRISFIRTLCLALIVGSLFGGVSTALAAGGDDGSDAPAASSAQVEGSYERAVVESVSIQDQKTTSTGQQVQVYRMRFLSGPSDGKVQEIRSDVGSNPYGLAPAIGDKVVIFIQPGQDGSSNYYLEGFDRRAALISLVALFVLMLIVLSGWQGFKVALSIAISIALIGYVLVPLFLRGYNPVPIAIILSGIFTLISTGLSTGWNRKSLVTAVGTVGGAMVAYAVSWLFADWAHLSGLATEEDRLFFDKNPLLNPRGLLFAGIIVASAGVVEDVAVSIASGVAEVRKANHRLTMRELFRAGMVIGNDHMAALANTLVYAYVGGSLSTLLLYTQFGGSWLKFINFDSVVDEIVRSLSGTIGLIFTVPITALLAAWAIKNESISSLESDTSSHGHSHHH
jgi:uncharacterized membrane protein